MSVKLIREKDGKKLDEMLEGVTGKVGKVGWFQNAKYDTKYKTPVAYVATIHEFGHEKKNIPARPFMTPTIVKQEKAWAEDLRKGALLVLDGKKTTDDILESVAMLAAGDIQQTISEIFEPALHPKTIQRRKRRYADKKTTGELTKPLIDTKHMFNTLIGKVEDP